MTPVKPMNILRHELIGLPVRVVEDSNPCNVSISGRVIDESRKTLVIRQGMKIKRIAKENASFLFSLAEGEIEVKGSALMGRPEERVKRRIRRRW